MYRRSATYVFVQGHNGSPSYQILSCGELWKFNGSFRVPSDQVDITAEEVVALLQSNVKNEIWKKCDALYKQRKRQRSPVAGISEERKSSLELMLEKKSVLLR